MDGLKREKQIVWTGSCLAGHADGTGKVCVSARGRLLIGGGGGSYGGGGFSGDRNGSVVPPLYLTPAVICLAILPWASPTVIHIQPLRG